MTKAGSAGLFAVLLAFGCGNRSDTTTPAGAATASAEPSSPSGPASSASGASGAPAASAAPSASASEPALQVRPRRPLEIKNSCGNVVTIVFGEDPNAKDAGKRTIAANSSIDGPRDAEGKLTVHLLDEKSQPIVTVHVTKGMKRVEIGASCRTLDAR